MAKIAAGEDFGRMAPQGDGLGRAVVVQQPGRVLQELGQRQVQDGLAAEHQAAQEAKQAQHERDMAARARATSVLSVTRDRIGDTLAEIDQQVQDGRLPKADAGKVWRERTQELIQSSMVDVPDAHRSLVQQDLQGLVTRFDSRVSDAVRRRDQHDTRADLSTTLESLQRAAVQDYEKAKVQAITALDQFGPAGGMAPDQIAKAKQTWLEGASYTRAFTAVQQAKHSNQALGVAEKAISSNADLDPQRQAQLLAQIDNYRATNEARAVAAAQRAEIAAQRRDREASQAWGVLSGWAMAGKIADPQASAGLVAKLEGTPYASAYRSLVADVGQRTAAAMLPLSVQQSQLDELKTRATKGTSQELEAEIKRREQVLNEARKDYGDDPLRAAAQRGVIDQIAPLDTRTLDGLAASVAARVDQAKAVGTRTGGSVSPLLPEEATRFADLLGALPVAERGKQIASLSAVMPTGMVQALAKQIDAKNRPLALEMAMGASKTTAGRYTAELVARGAQAIKDKSVKEDPTAETGLRASLVKELGDALSGRARDDVLDAARFIYLGQQAQGNSVSARSAISLALGGTLQEFNGKRIPLPAGVDPSGLRQRLQGYPHEALAKQLPDATVYLPGGRPLGLPEFLAGLPDAQLEPAGLGRYMVRSGNGLAMNKDRRPVVIEVAP